MSADRLVPAWEAPGAVGAVVVVDVLRAFTSAAYAFAAGACRIWLVQSVEEALAMKAAHPGLLAMGEDLGRRVPGFDFSNSPAEVARADLGGRGGARPADLGRNPHGGRRLVGGAALVCKPRLRVRDRGGGGRQRTRRPDVRDHRVA